MIHFVDVEMHRHIPVFTRRRLQCGRYLEVLIKVFTSDFLDPQSWDHIEPAVCFITQLTLHALKCVTTSPQPTCISTSQIRIHSLGII